MAKTTQARTKKVHVALIFAAVTVVGVILLGWTAWTLRLRYTDEIYWRADLESLPEQPVTLVFGAGYWPNGVLSLILRERLDAAIELYESGRVTKLLLSRDNPTADYNEPERMLDYVMGQGVPREDVILDYAGRRTYDTCYRAREIFQLTEATLISQAYHLPRAMETCQALGLNVVGYAANRYRHTGYYLILYRLREVPALWRAWWDLYVARPKPILGDTLPIFDGEAASQ
ncbi:MAG: SanA/YdcF family protein [Anaerolineae bacterium]